MKKSDKTHHFLKKSKKLNKDIMAKAHSKEVYKIWVGDGKKKSA